VGIPGVVLKIIRDFTHANIINNIMKAFPEAKQPGHGAVHPTPTGAEVKVRVLLCLYCTSGPS